MNIAATQYFAEHRALEIYLSGCDASCRGCHNPELWDFCVGDNWRNKIDDILDKVRLFDTLIDNIWVLGGEPLLQDHNELCAMLEILENTGKRIWLFTRFEDYQVPDDVKQYCDYLKCGAYKEELRCDNNIQYGIKLATSNQYIRFYKRRARS